MKSKGYVQVYTGDGKGKTTAALGLATRAACAGYKIYIGQFAKGMDYSELKIGDLIPSITIEQYGRDSFITMSGNSEDTKKARIGLEKIKEIINSSEYDVVILDEINIALNFNLVDLSDVLDIIKNKPDDVELVLTGRYAPKEIIDVADLVTEMKEIKHYYNDGVIARKGIEN